MKNNETTIHAHHEEVIKENETTVIPSIFMFKGGSEELFPFVHVCKEKNSTLYFENEDITIKPDADVYSNIPLTFYGTIAAYPNVAIQYMRYMMNIDKMKWPD